MRQSMQAADASHRVFALPCSSIILHRASMFRRHLYRLGSTSDTFVANTTYFPSGGF